MSADSSGSAGLPEATAGALRANYSPALRLLNRPISGGPGPRGGRSHANRSGHPRPEAASPWRPPHLLRSGRARRPLSVQGPAEPTGGGAASHCAALPERARRAVAAGPAPPLASSPGAAHPAVAGAVERTVSVTRSANSR